MYFLLILCWSFLIPCTVSFDFSLLSGSNGSIIIANANFSQGYTKTINSNVVYLFQFKTNQISTPAKIITESKSASETYPVLIVVQQPNSVNSWQIPYIAGPRDSPVRKYPRTSRILCPAFHGNTTFDEVEESILVMVSSPSPDSITFYLIVDKIDLNIPLGEIQTAHVSPSESEFYSFTFPPDVSSGLLQVTSDSDVCMSLSIQNFSCPVYDQEDNLKFRGYWETVTTKGGMMLTRDAFPKRLFVVFVVHADDEECTGYEGGSIEYRNKTVEFIITRNITYVEYLIATIVVVSTFAVIYLFALFLAFYARHAYSRGGPTFDDGVTNSSRCIYTDDPDASFNTKNIQNEYNFPTDGGQASTSGTEHRYNEIVAYNVLCVYDLSKEAHEVLRAKSNLYFWNLLTIATFYSLPVIQLVFTYQKVLNQSGNQDLCYYNFLCSHRLDLPLIGTISDFNHIFSNIGYILLGNLFLLIVFRREKLEDRKDTGIPQHYGLYYTLGASLVMEGVLSACYHFCPNHSNFQFDTSFMYILAVISMIKIYQSRHPDINASAYLAFGVLAFLIFLGMYGVLNGSRTFYYIFTALHLYTCMYLSAQIYFMGQWQLDRGVHKRAHQNIFSPILRREKNWWRPNYPSRMVLLVLGNICNWALIGIDLYGRLGDFATYLLAILLSNLLLYFTFYILMKLICHEKILSLPLLCIVMALLCWGAAIYFFIHKSISWKETPARSRTYNQPCYLLNFYDRHDVWHFLSAASMFFSFMVLLTLDDDLANVDRQQISVF